MNSFHEDLELSKKTSPFIDAVYTELLQTTKIKRTNTEANNNEVLDREFHIDTIIERQNGTKITLQEKILRNEKSSFNTFTMEFYQNRHSKEKGEFFNICSQYYFHGYLNENEDGLEKWYIINVSRLNKWLSKYNIKQIEEQKTRPSTSNASFFWVNYNNIPKDCIEYSYKD
ncbi:MAG: hypothetical protein KAX49_12930 [Halanaerobiales bacterium]|nr:hypothetical protein [Halanaerobiales bacterium]